MTNRSQKSRQRTAIFHFSLVICHFADAICHCSFAISAVVRKNVAPASSRHTVLLTQKELSRLTCRRDAGATIISHDLCLRVEIRSTVEDVSYVIISPHYHHTNH